MVKKLLLLYLIQIKQFLFILGPLAIGVPGELKGYWEAHKKFGKLPWKAIIEPNIKLCESGYVLGEHQHYSLFRNARIKNDTNLK